MIEEETERVPRTHTTRTTGAGNILQDYPIFHGGNINSALGINRIVAKQFVNNIRNERIRNVLMKRGNGIRTIRVSDVDYGQASQN